jgi:hypothetical protein
MSSMRSRSGSGFGRCAIIVALVFIAMIAAGLVVHDRVQRQTDARDRVVGARTCLESVRSDVENYVKENGHYPPSLHELWQWRFPKGDARLGRSPLEKNRDEEPECRNLDGKGGWCYDPNTGKVRINITRPVKEYLPHYAGPKPDDIPAEW